MNGRKILFWVVIFCANVALAENVSTLCEGENCNINTAQSEALVIDKDLSTLNINADISSDSNSAIYTNNVDSNDTENKDNTYTLGNFVNNATISTSVASSNGGNSTPSSKQKAAIELGGLNVNYFTNNGTIMADNVSGIVLTRNQNQDNGNVSTHIANFTNYGTISGGTNGIYLEYDSNIDTLINYGTISGGSSYAIKLGGNYSGVINALYNYGTIDGGILISSNSENTSTASSIYALYNYGTILPSNDGYHFELSKSSEKEVTVAL